MKKLKRISAIAGIVLLAGMYISTLIFALIDNPATMGLLKASIALTILIPVLLYGFLLIMRLSHRNDPHDDEDNADHHM